jgi:hypothetical protein
MKYVKPLFSKEEIEVVDVINASIVKVANVNKVVDTGEVDAEGNPIMKEVTATQVSVDISNLF